MRSCVLVQVGCLFGHYITHGDSCTKLFCTMDWAHVKHVCSDIVRVLGGWRKASVAAILCGAAPVFMLWLASKRRRPIPITFGELLTALQVK